MIKLLKIIPKETYLLISLMLFIFAIPVAEHLVIKKFLFNISYGIVLVSIYFITNKKSLFWNLLVSLNLLLIILMAFVGSVFLSLLTFFISTITALISVVILVFHIVKSKNVDLRLIIETIAGYLLIGTVMFFLNTILFRANNTAFNIPNHSTVQVMQDIMYYSFVTLTTIGYGDISPQSPAARVLSMFFGVAGQMYLALIVAFIMGKFLNKKSSQ